MSRIVHALAIVGLASVAAHAEPLSSSVVFPVVAGTKLTFTSVELKDTWTTTLTLRADLAQYVPHNDTLNYFTKAGFRVLADGIYVVGETLADLNETPPAAARAIAFPLKKGGVGKVPGLIPTTYSVGAREKIKVKAGAYDAWKINITDKLNPAGAVWLAPGVGIVKIQLPSGRIDELVKTEPPASK